MPQKVCNNVVGHRIIDNGLVVEDVTSVTLPTISHPTTTISASGMVMDVDMPNTAHLDAMELTVAHNNGVNSTQFANPGKHMLEVRIVRNNYNVAIAEMENESVKYRITALHKSCDKGNVEQGNPLGSSDKFSVLRYEEEINGEVVTIVDAMAGVLKFNGIDVTEDIESMLN